jgi:glutamine synthetase
MSTILLQAPNLPATLSDSVEALEKDEELKSHLGEKFVAMYVDVKRDIDIARFNHRKADLITEEEQFEFEREFYLRNF